ncbi:hypothetical protein SDRG_14996 [Saprolegnia diclina VS20]|uniref:START domain-containing protein n=1 Tax=Saprolegnia diclina (strain VS20) TaxID=1156394 RepID=T0PP29_SAPDV|nr:hypothetical protein SDRG_14996 [Saprolegnia diclina VS20]EQC27194.1 hypothetical protein SDRG_14996 [Saprolegnia diclina VS20]|eukprot:XP_008619381.1 hypothetical protein SDRG_14996 [Saprolegnia diclina VS20]
MENPSLLSELLPIDELQLDRDIAYYLTSDVRMNAQPFEMHAPRPMATSPSSQSPSESEPGKEESISQKYRRRQKEELKHLQEQVAQLSGHLSVLTNVKALEAEGGSEWERMARNQKLNSQRALSENSRLKRALEEQLKIAQALDQLLIKRPRLATFPTLDLDDWKLRKLSADMDRRRSSFHALVDDAHEQVDAMLLRAGLMEASEDTRHLNVTVNARGDSIVLEAHSLRYRDCNFISNGMKCWAVFNHREGIVLPNNATLEVLEQIDENSVYVRITSYLDKMTPFIQTLGAVKRYIENDRIVFVLQTVLDDEVHPHQLGFYIGNMTATVVVVPQGPYRSMRRLCLSGQLPLEPPKQNPLCASPRSLICDVFLNHLRTTFDALEHLMG